MEGQELKGFQINQVFQVLRGIIQSRQNKVWIFPQQTCPWGKILNKKRVKDQNI